MKVALLVPRLAGGGAEFVAVQWAIYLRDHGINVTVVTTHGTDEERAGLAVVNLDATSFGARVLQLRHHVADAGYDVLVSLMPHWNVLALLAVLGRGRRAPTVLISGRNAESALRPSQDRTYRYELRLARALYRRADGYIAISHPVAAEAAARYGIASSRIWVVPNPATAKLARGAADRRATRRGHDGVFGRSVTLTVPARLMPQKCPEVAVEVAALLSRQYGVSACVDYFGAGPEQQRVAAAAAALGVQVCFKGWVDCWFDETAADAVVLLPSAAEGFGNVLVEAAGVGIASVASSRALGVADAIVPGVTGALAMGSSTVDFATAVLEAMNLTPVRPGQWLERFSPEESGRKLLQVLHDSTSWNGPAVASQPLSTTAHR